MFALSFKLGKLCILVIIIDDVGGVACCVCVTNSDKHTDHLVFPHG